MRNLPKVVYLVAHVKASLGLCHLETTENNNFMFYNFPTFDLLQEKLLHPPSLLQGR